MDYQNIFGLRIGQRLWNNKTGEVIMLTSQLSSDSKAKANLSYEELVPFGLGIGGDNHAGIWFAVGIGNIMEWELIDNLLDPNDGMTPRTRACLTILYERIRAIEMKFEMLRSI